MTLDPIIEKIEASRTELLDLSLRNPLLNYRTLKARGVEVVDEIPSKVFDLLVHKGREMSFLPRPDDGAAYEQVQLDFDDDSDIPARRHTDNRLQTNEPSGLLQSRLLRTYYTANTTIQEQGVNTLFVAIGMVEWYESDNSAIARRAPLMLVPVKIERSDARSRFKINYTGEELGANLSFIEKARADFRMEIPVLPEEEELDVDDYFGQVALQIETMNKWSVDRESVVLGFFSFSKFLMYKDLDPHNDAWPAGAGPLQSRIIRAIYQDGFAEPESTISDEDHLDEHLRPEDVHHVVDADSSQAVAIHDVNSGRNLVIQGPPGTGKSQTITNIIAEAIGGNRKVLFVSEKMAALEVVKRRLDGLHLGGACLELHSHKTAKKVVLDELKRTWELGKPNVGEVRDDFAALTRVRTGLNEYAEAVNAPVGGTGVSPFDAYGELVRIRSSVKDYSALPLPEVDGIDSWSRSVFDQKRNVVSNLEANLKRVGILRDHVFWGCQLRMALPSDISSIRREVDAAAQSLKALRNASRALGDALRLDVPIDAAHAEKLVATAGHVIVAPGIRGIDLAAAEWRDRRDDMELLRESGVGWARLRDEYDPVLTPDAWATSVWDIRRTLSTTGRRRLKILSSKYRRAKKQLSMLCRGELPGDLEEQMALADAIIEERELRETIDRLSSVASAALGRLWEGEHTDWETVSAAIVWTLNLFNDIDEGKVDPNVIRVLADGLDTVGLPRPMEHARDALDSHRGCSKSIQDSLKMDVDKRFRHPDGLTRLPFEEQRQILENWASRTDDIHDIALINGTLTAVKEEGLQSIAELAEEWQVAPHLLTTCFEYTRYERILARALDGRPALVDFHGDNHESQIVRFGEMDNRALDHNRTRVAHAHWEGLPNRDGAGQLRILRREMEKKRRHLPIRRLIKSTGNAIQAIKPVFMMSPMSIATYVEPGSVSFDLVVFDEASQVRPVDALGALMRAEQAVVVGDDRQLPPTSFFDAATHDDEADDFESNVTADMESILGLMGTAGCPNKMLRWHYRSRHESLIALSNREFYANRLVVFPSPDSGKQHVGLHYHHVPNSVYDRGLSRTNRKEAGEVAKAVMEHARQHPDLTLGAAAFSSAQMQAVLDELEVLRRQDASCEPFFNAHPEEPFFVKNLENVQGDERDVIFISVGYGRDANGQVAMNFGPLNRDGGERRLNVIITRARRRCHVFTNLRADDINLSAAGSPGVRALKTFLAYAESGNLPTDVPIESGRDVDSPFQTQVVSKLRSLDYEAHDEIASGGKFVDIGIVDPDRPGRYLLGIECDGAAYHSSRSARDRDRLREQHLKSLGWKLHRIWSTDWFRNEERELRRVVEAIERAKAARPVDRVAENEAIPEIERVHYATAPGEPQVPAYQVARPRVVTRGYELHEVPSEYLRRPIAEIVRIEGPVHVREVERRIASAVGVKRIGHRIKHNLERAIGDVTHAREVVRKGEFLWKPRSARRRPGVRDRTDLPGKRIDWVPPEEIAHAVTMVVERSHGIDRVEAAAETGKLLGFRNATKSVRTPIDRAIADLIRNGELVGDGDHLMTA